MKKAVVLFANGFEEIEAVTPADVLRRAGIEVATAGVGGREIEGAHGMIVHTDTLLELVPGGGHDLLVIPGGMPGAKNIGEAPLARELAAEMLDSGKLVAAICAAPVMTLGAWGLLAGKRATCYPGMEVDFPESVVFSSDRVVVDGNITTSRGPGTALEFALSLAARVAGEDAAAKVAAAMLAAPAVK